MSGEGVIPNTGAVIPVAATDAGAGDVAPARSGNLLRRIARHLLPHPAAIPLTFAIAAQGFSDEQLREIDRRILVTIRKQRDELQRRRI